MQSRFRLFAGPNGSGKTYLFDRLKRQGYIHTELYINADKILRDLKERGNFNFNAYHIKSSEEEFRLAVKNSGLFKRMNDPDFLSKIHLNGGVLIFDIDRKDLNAYHASFIATYLCEKLFDTHQSFCFETVMSHQDKLLLFDLARSKKYKSYLYFVFTENPDLNVARVKLRAQEGLHDVAPDIVKDRYYRTFTLLPKAIDLADEAYVIDNSLATKEIIIKQKNRISIKTGVKLTSMQSNLLSEILTKLDD